MKPVAGAIHELPLPQVLLIVLIAYHTCIQQLPTPNSQLPTPNSQLPNSTITDETNIYYRPNRQTRSHP